MASPPNDNDSLIDHEQGPYQVYIRSLGNRSVLVLPFLKRWIGKFETHAAVRRKVEQDIKLVRPTLFGLAKETAEAVAERLISWGAVAAAYHDQDERRPQYDHNRYGVNLLEVGSSRHAVQAAVGEILGISQLDAMLLIDSAPMSILSNVSVEEAIAAHERLSKAGAICELLRPEAVWLDPSTSHIPRSPGSYLVILQHIGPQKLIVNMTVVDLLPHLSEAERQKMLSKTPVVLLQDVSLETAELVKLKLEHFAATVIIQETAERQKLGEAIHPQNPAFGYGAYQVVLDGFKQYKKIFVIQEIRKLCPGMYLTDIIALFDEKPGVVVDNVNQDSAEMIRDRLLAAGALARVRES